MTIAPDVLEIWTDLPIFDMIEIDRLCPRRPITVRLMVPDGHYELPPADLKWIAGELAGYVAYLDQYPRDRIEAVNLGPFDQVEASADGATFREDRNVYELDRAGLHHLAQGLAGIVAYLDRGEAG